jgi:threonine/homoserine/homoserine lactone efflux protein
MHDIAWFLFISTSLILIATPGPDMMLVMSRALAQGTASGVLTAAGISVGLLGHTLLAALGLGALLVSSASLFNLIKVAGALYLVWLGLGAFRSAAEPVRTDVLLRSTRQVFTSGMVANLSNPKVAIFFFAFLPQFVRPGPPHFVGDILLMGVVFAMLTLGVKASVAVLAGALSARLRREPAILCWMQRASGLIIIALGLGLAAEQRPAR